ncbi:MAG TPA: glutamate formimidoyltransferase [Planctomycetota bacterium]|nr:glutamate formimidoyltransferase [Planctomycetota bacterium]
MVKSPAVILESVPNFSEGRSREVCEAIAGAARAAGAKVLDLEMDKDHHRSVLTFIGTPETAAAAAFAAAKKAVELIDLTRHQGQHPRMGAIDVLPFVPLQGAAMDDAVRTAREVGRRIGDELRLPVYLYEAAASRPDRKNLAEIRRPQFEGLRDLVGKDPDRIPDFGPNAIHPTAGCVAVGARLPLIAYNIDLETDDVSVAKKIARKIRERDGGLPGIKALGLPIADRKCAQVSMNVCDYTRTGLLDVFRAVEAEAGRLGTQVRSSEVIGLLPRAALPPDGERLLKLAGFAARQVLESHLS